MKIEKLLIDNKIKYEYQYSCGWLNRQSLDFYLYEYNLAIECQGIQHFESIEFFGGADEFKKIIKKIRKKKINLMLGDVH
jgi:hypothetical protein